jgi:hypothetical protein
VATDAAFDVLRPKTTIYHWLALVVGLALIAWLPSIGSFSLQGSSADGYELLINGYDVELQRTSLDISAVGGLTITQLQATGPNRLIGAWVLDETQTQRFDDVTDEWTRRCLSERGDLIGQDASCALPKDSTQADQLLARLVGLGLPLTDQTALPRHLRNGQSASLAMLWLAPTCEDANASAMPVQLERFGVKRTTWVHVFNWPGCH